MCLQMIPTQWTKGKLEHVAVKTPSNILNQRLTSGTCIFTCIGMYTHMYKQMCTDSIRSGTGTPHYWTTMLFIVRLRRPLAYKNHTVLLRIYPQRNRRDSYVLSIYHVTEFRQANCIAGSIRIVAAIEISKHYC
jgi:hypothetical protein